MSARHDVAARTVTLLHLGWGGANACPPPDEQARVWERCAEAWGAEPVLLSRDNLLSAIAVRPVDTGEGSGAWRCTTST